VDPLEDPEIGNLWWIPKNRPWIEQSFTKKELCCFLWDMMAKFEPTCTMCPLFDPERERKGPKIEIQTSGRMERKLDF